MTSGYSQKHDITTPIPISVQKSQAISDFLYVLLTKLETDAVIYLKIFVN